MNNYWLLRIVQFHFHDEGMSNPCHHREYQNDYRDDGLTLQNTLDAIPVYLLPMAMTILAHLVLPFSIIQNQADLACHFLYQHGLQP